jgi:hypothetical protein
MRIGTALVCTAATAGFVAATVTGIVPTVYGCAGGATCAVGGALSLRAVLVPPAAALGARETRGLAPRRRDAEAIGRAIRSSCTPLPKDLYERTCDALVNAFGDYDTLAQLTRYELDTSLTHIAAPGPLPTVVFALLRWTESRGCTDRLIAGAFARRPEHAPLAALVRSLEET